jgi:hypothetical protein
MIIPEALKYWSADEVAECLDGISSNLYRKLWQIETDNPNSKPLGGDGSNGTVEEPVISSEYGQHWWDQLTEEEQKVIADGLRRYQSI